MEETIFSKIIAGTVPSHKIYEDDLVFAFLDVHPLAPGHTLVIPKKAAATLDQLDADSSAAIGRVLPQISRAVLKAVGAKDFNILQNNGANANQSVFHVHFHVIPKMSDGRGLEVKWSPASIENGDVLAEDIRDQLSIS